MSLLFRIILVTILLFAGSVLLSCNQSGSTVDTELHKRLAGELRDNKLYKAAVEEYEKILADNTIEPSVRANINYLIGKIYFENIKDYEQAAAYYIKARSLDPNGSFISEASKNLVASLEKIGHVLDAKRQLDDATDVDNQPRHKGDVAVARIGGVPICLSDVEQQIQTMPLEIQKRFLDRSEKINFVHQYVGMELIYRAAVRENYGNQPEVTDQLRLLERRLIIDKYVLDKVIPDIKIDTMDVRNFYVANKTIRYNDTPYDSVKAQVFLDYQMEKTEAAYTDYIGDLAKVEKVEFLDHNVK